MANWQPCMWAGNHGDSSIFRLQWATSTHRKENMRRGKGKILLTRIPPVHMTNVFQPSPNPYLSAPLHFRNQRFKH